MYVYIVYVVFVEHSAPAACRVDARTVLYFGENLEELGLCSLLSVVAIVVVQKPLVHTKSAVRSLHWCSIMGRIETYKASMRRK